MQVRYGHAVKTWNILDIELPRHLHISILGPKSAQKHQ